MHNVSLAFRTQLLRSGNRAYKKLKLLLVFFAQVEKDQTDADSVMRSFNLGAASHYGIVDAKHEKQFGADRERGDSFNIATGRADVTQIAKDRRGAFITAQLNATGYVETLLVSPGSWHVLHRSPCFRGRLRRSTSTGDARRKSAWGHSLRPQLLAEEAFARFQAKNSNLPGLGGVTAYPYHLAARFLFTVLQRDYLAFTDTVDTDQPRTDRCGIYRTRMLHERLSIQIQTPNLHVKADSNTRLNMPDHKYWRGLARWYCQKGTGFNGNMHLGNVLKSGDGGEGLALSIR